MADLRAERDGHVAIVTLNRPDRLNAITAEMLDTLSATLLDWDADRSVRAIVMTGAGRGFCAGLDLQNQAQGVGIGAESGAGVKISEHPPFVLRRIDTPVICALNGPAVGYGMDLALGCDLLIASENAVMQSPTQRGLMPESGGTWLLPRLIGWQKAAEVFLVARRLDATELQRLGLTNVVVAHDDLMAEARRWADEIAANAPLAVSAAKRAMRFGLDSSFEANGHHVMAELIQLLHSADFKEGLAAFLEKRPAVYEGR